MSNLSQLERIRKGTEKWNAWREQEPQTIPDLRDANLQGVRLSRAKLSGASINRAKLSGADLSGADLSQADLHRTTLYSSMKDFFNRLLRLL